MNLITTSYFQPTQNHTALLLQHYRYNSTHLCLACICAAETPAQGKAAAYLTEQLLHWFRNLSWRKLSRNPEKHLPVTETQLRKTIARATEDLISSRLIPPEICLHFSGILCIDEHFLLFCQGTPKIYLLNRNFNRAHIRCVSDELFPSEEKNLIFRQGILQPDVGLLLATETFCRCATGQELKDCLHVEEVSDQDRANRHLWELGSRGEAQGGCHMGAVLLRTGSEKFHPV